ncbi:hypothetical protein G7Y79_00007g020870 [Physcia stellaris]|nr:hypothetical protein G7Y79_00007g020870 [Physcia stellaris]
MYLAALTLLLFTYVYGLSAAVLSRNSTLSINGSQSNPPSFNVMHYHLDTAPGRSLSLTKRDRPRAMTRCPNFDARRSVFLRSNCVRNGNLRNLMMYCGDGHYVHVIPQACNNNEICVDTSSPARSRDAKAYCVSANNFFRIPSSEQQQVTGDFELHIPSNSKPFAAEALVVDWARIHGLRRTENFELSSVWEIVPPEATAIIGGYQFPDSDDRFEGRAGWLSIFNHNILTEAYELEYGLGY